MDALGSQNAWTEQRRLKRLEVELQVKYRPNGTSNSKEAKSKDLGEGGIGLFLPELLPVNTLMDLEILIPGETSPFYATGKIVWRTDSSKHITSERFLNLNGIYFVKIAPDHKNRLNRFLTTLISQEPTIIGRWHLPHKKFVFYKQVTLKHTNVEGNTYFDNYLTWRGEAREALLLTHPKIEVFLRDFRNTKLITHSVYQKFLRDSFFGDIIRIEVISTKIKFCSFVLVYRFYNERSNALIGEGWERICTGNPTTGHLIAVPQLILDLIEPIQEEVKASFFGKRC